MNWSQISGILDRVVLMGLMYLAGRGIITNETAVSITSLVIGVLGAIYGWYNNRPASIIASAADLPGTKIVTTPELAAIPATNVVSNTESKVVPK